MGRTAGDSPVVINGWTIYAHPLFLDQLEALLVEVEALRAKDLQGYVSKNASKRLAAIARLMLQDIPQDPSRKEYQQGSTLGAAHRHWRRAKFFQQYRLFFRFHAASRIIVLAWVNDEDTRRAYESATSLARAQSFQRDALALTLASNTAVAAVQEASLQQQITVTRNMVQIQQQLLNLLKARMAAHVCSTKSVPTHVW